MVKMEHIDVPSDQQLPAKQRSPLDVRSPRDRDTPYTGDARRGSVPLLAR